MAQMPNNYYQWVSLSDAANVAAPQEWSTEMIIQDIMNTPQTSQLQRELQNQQFGQSGLFAHNIIVSNAATMGKATITNSRAAASVMDLSNQQTKGFNSVNSSNRGFQYNNYQQQFNGHTKAMNKVGILTNKGLLQQSPTQLDSPPKEAAKNIAKNQKKAPAKPRQRKSPAQTKPTGDKPASKVRTNTSMYERVVPKFVSEPEAHMAVSVFATLPKISLAAEQVNHWVSCPSQRPFDAVAQAIEQRRLEKLDQIRSDMNRRKFLKPAGLGAGMPKYQPRANTSAANVKKYSTPTKSKPTSPKKSKPTQFVVKGQSLVKTSPHQAASTTTATTTRVIDSDSESIEEVTTYPHPIQTPKKGRLSVAPARHNEQAIDPEAPIPTDPSINWEHRIVTGKTRDPERRRLACLLLSGDYDVEMRYRPRSDKVSETASIELRKTEEEVCTILLQVCKTRKPSNYLEKNIGTRKLLYNKMHEQYKKTMKNTEEFSEMAFKKYFEEFVESLDFKYQTTQDEKRDPFSKQKKELDLVASNSRVEKEINNCYVSVGMPEKVVQKTPARPPVVRVVVRSVNEASIRPQKTPPKLTQIPTGRRGRPGKNFYANLENGDQDFFEGFRGPGATAKVTRGKRVISMTDLVPLGKRQRKQSMIVDDDDYGVKIKKVKPSYNTRNAPQQSCLFMRPIVDVRSYHKIEARLLNSAMSIMEKRQTELRDNLEIELDVNESISAMLAKLDPLPDCYILIKEDADADLIVDRLAPGAPHMYLFSEKKSITDPDFYDVSKLVCDLVKKVSADDTTVDDGTHSQVSTSTDAPRRRGRPRKQLISFDWPQDSDSPQTSVIDHVDEDCEPIDAIDHADEDIGVSANFDEEEPSDLNQGDVRMQQETEEDEQVSALNQDDVVNMASPERSSNAGANEPNEMMSVDQSGE